MAIENFVLRPQSDNALRRELLLPVGAGIDYENEDERIQRGLLVADRELTSSVTAKEITRGFKLDVTQTEEAAMWIREFPTVSLQVPADLSAVSDTVEFDFYADDPEGTAFAVQTGTIPSPLTAAFGVDDNAKDLTITYPAQTANPGSNQSFQIPVWLEQPLGAMLPGTRRNLAVRVLRFAPQGLHSAYPSPALFGRLYIDSNQDHFEITLTDHIRNPSGRPLRVGNGPSFSHSWSTALANFTIGETSSTVFSLRGDRVSPWVLSGPQTANVIIRIATNDAGDTSTVFLHFLLRVVGPTS